MGDVVKKGLMIITMSALFALAAPAHFSPASHTLAYAPAQAEDAISGMKRLNLILKKLRDAMGSMKEFDDLEKAGLRKKDVDRMRRAMNDKINQMMEDAIYAIRAL